MSNVDNYEIYSSLENELKKMLERNKNLLESKTNKLNDPEKKVKFLEKITLNTDIKNYQNIVNKLLELEKKIFSLKYAGGNGYELAETLKNQLIALGPLLEQEEVSKLRTHVIEDFKSCNKEKKDIIEKLNLEIKNILKELKLNEVKINVYNVADSSDIKVPFENLIDTLVVRKIKELSLDNLFISSRKEEINYLSIEDEQNLNKLEEIRKNANLRNNDIVKEVIENYARIKKEYYDRAKAREVVTITSSAVSNMRDITEVNFTNTIKYLQKIHDEYAKKIEKANAFLNKFNLDYIEEQVILANEIREKENIEKNNYNEYKNLSYELEKTMIENPKNYEKIQSLREKMENLSNKLGLSNEIKEKAFNEGKKEYRKDVTVKKDNPVYNIESLREFAIMELEEEKAFDKNNGDKEELIINKIEELIELVDMKPEERGLIDWKKNGLISKDATVKDLSPQQLNDLRLGYSDSSYPFIKEYREMVKRGVVVPSERTIYGEYTRYLAALEDKSTKMSFRQFAKEKYGLESVNISIIEDETKGKSR